MAVGRSNPRVRGRGALAISLTALLALVALFGTAAAQEVPTVTGRITDLTGTLEDTSGAEAAIADLEEEHGVQLYVLWVETTSGLTATEFTDAVAEQNSFGANEALLMVALEDRTYSAWLGDTVSGEVSDEELDEIFAEDFEPALVDGDFPGAIAGFANGLGDAVGGGSGGGGGSGLLIAFLVIVVLAVIGVIAWLVWRMVKNRRSAEERDRQTGQLAKEANGLLLQTDEKLREAEQELGFAEAQFAEADVAPFRESLGKAKGEMQAAFAIRQQLDDEKPEKPDERRRMLEELVAHCKAADQEMESHRKRFQELRDLEKNAPAILAAVPAQADAIDARAQESQDSMARLQQYAESSWKHLEGNIVEAGKRTAWARESVTEGLAAIEAGRSSEGGQEAREAQIALAEAAALHDAIKHQDEAAQAAVQNLPTEIAAAEADIAAARAAVDQGRAGGSAEAVARAEALLDSARREAASPKMDPFAAIKFAGDANATADSVLEGVRAAEEQRARAEANLASTIARADAGYRQAADFVLGRSQGVGREARTRLAEAERHLAAARELQGTDLSRAASEAGEAERLASDAFRLAQSDFRQYDRGRSNPMGGGGGPGLGTLGAIVLGSVLTGGGRGGGGFGGTAWGSPSRGRSSGRSVSRTFGGGGGGRSRGGRW